VDVIEVKNLKKYFSSTKAVDDISFEIAKGEIFGFLGPNGSGKTTTLRMLATILRPTEGEIIILQKNLRNNIYKVKKEIGYIPQKEALYPDLTVKENLEFFNIGYDLSRELMEKKIQEALRLLKLDAKSNMLARTLSGGFLKRLSIAVELVHNPEVLICDEITVGLDPVSRHDIWEVLKKLKKHSTIIFTTHYLEEAEELCDRVALMSGGRILCIGKPREIADNFKAKNLNHVFAKLAGGEIN